jgi:hypothetical protein
VDNASRKEKTRKYPWKTFFIIVQERKLCKSPHLLKELINPYIVSVSLVAHEVGRLLSLGKEFGKVASVNVNFIDYFLICETFL